MSATRATKKAASPATRKPHEENRGKSVWVEAPDGSVGRRQPGWEDAPEPESAPAQIKPTRKPPTPAKSGDPRADRAAATKKAEAVTARAAKAATPKAKPVTKKAATPKAKVTPSNGLKAALIEQGWTVALTRNQAIAAYCKQRTLLHGAGPEAYRKATAKALGITDAEFLAAFYAPKAEGK